MSLEPHTPPAPPSLGRPRLFAVAAVFAGLASSRLLALPPHPKFGEVIAYQLNGLVVVFLALGMIWGMMETLGFAFRRLAARQAARIVVTPPAPPPVATPATGADPAFYIVIAAAVYSALGDGHRIVEVTPVRDSHDWSREGRRDHFHSHRVR